MTNYNLYITLNKIYFWRKVKCIIIKTKKLKWSSVCSAIVMAINLIPTINASAASYSETESNNTRATANTIKVNDTYTAKIGSSGDIDCFKFLPKENDKIRVDLSNIPSGKKYNIWLQDNNGNELMRETSTGTSKHVVYDVVANTSYYIVINGSGSSDYSSSQNYTLGLKSINFSYLGSTSYSGSGSISIDASALQSPYTSYLTTARNSWHSAVSSVTFSSNSSSKNKIYSDTYKDTWFGFLSTVSFRWKIRVIYDLCESKDS